MMARICSICYARIVGFQAGARSREAACKARKLDGLQYIIDGMRLECPDREMIERRREDNPRGQVGRQPVEHIETGTIAHLDIE